MNRWITICACHEFTNKDDFHLITVETWWLPNRLHFFSGSASNHWRKPASHKGPKMKSCTIAEEYRNVKEMVMMQTKSYKHIRLYWHTLGCPPSQDSSGKWRFSSGSPILKIFIILVVTSQHPGQGDNPSFTIFSSDSSVILMCWFKEIELWTWGWWMVCFKIVNIHPLPSHPKRKFMFQPLIFRGENVSFKECK